MKFKSLLIAFFAILISCSAFSQDNPKTSTTHHKEMKQHKKHHKHHKHMKEGSKADKKEDKK